MDQSRAIAVEDGDVYVSGDGAVYDKYDDEYPLRNRRPTLHGRRRGLRPGARDLPGRRLGQRHRGSGRCHLRRRRDRLVLPPDNQTWPDGLIRRQGGADLGDDLYWTWDGQTATTRARRGRERVFFVTAQNDDNVAVDLHVGADKTVGRRWRVRYYAGEQNITKEIGGGYETPTLAPGEQVEIKVTMMPRARARIGSLCRVKFFVSSTVGDHTRTDRVRAEARVRRG
jgi:hypothetical protein